MARPGVAAPARAKISLQRLMEAAESIETPRLVQKWALLLALVSSVVSVILAIALMVLLPMKEYVPYFVVERSDASVVKSDSVGSKFVPSENNLRYFASRFVRDLLTIDEQMRFNLPASYEFTRGAAVAQWRQFVQQTDRPQARLSNDPSLRRQVVFEGAPQLIAASADARTGSFVFFIREITTAANQAPKVQRVRVTLDYMTSPPNDLNQALKNPIGFFVTNLRYEPLDQ